ncbi:MAG: hypothetical protein Kow002_11810 [Anaerolineales bacterium]
MYKKRFIPLFLMLVTGLFSACQLLTPVPPLPVSTPTIKTNSGETLFFDDFSNKATGWDRFTAAEGTMDYDGGGYRILVNALQTNFWSTPGKNFGDVRLEVDVAKWSGPDENRFGLLCRFIENNYYFFLLSSDGYYTIGKYLGGNAFLLGQTEMQPSDSIHQGLAVNHLRADCVGDTLTLYVNGVQVAEAKDPDLAQGDVGLLAGTFAQPGVDILFDNFVVIQP